MKIRSAVGLIPLLAVEVLEQECSKQLPRFEERMEWYLRHRPQLAGLISNWQVRGSGERRLLSLLRGHRMKALSRGCWTKQSFFPITACARFQNITNKIRFVIETGGQAYEVAYWPGETHAVYSAAIPTGAARSGCRSTICSSKRCKNSINTMATISDRMSDRFGGNLCPSTKSPTELTRRLLAAIFQRRRRPASVFGDIIRNWEDPNFRDTFCSTNIFTATPAAAVALRIKPAGRVWWPNYFVREKNWVQNKLNQK